jgi:hypothetical protein
MCLLFSTKQKKRHLMPVSDAPVGFKIFPKESNDNPDGVDSAVSHTPVCVNVSKCEVNGKQNDLTWSCVMDLVCLKQEKEEMSAEKIDDGTEPAVSQTPVRMKTLVCGNDKNLLNFIF